jgi:hypothetical protein
LNILLGQVHAGSVPHRPATVQNEELAVRGKNTRRYTNVKCPDVTFEWNCF